MKAITCPQCGALVRTVSPKDKLALCEYCDAKIILPEEKTEKGELPPSQRLSENYPKAQERASQRDASFTYPDEKNNKAVLVPLVFMFAVIGAFILIGANTKSCLSRPLADAETKTPFKTASSPKFEYTVPTPPPSIHYQVKVKWQGDNDMEHFENPQIETSKLPSLDETELKKTVFKNRAVEVRITIDTDGAVTKAEALSGHPILKESAVQAARKTIFNPRRKPTSRVLTYYFHLTGEN